MIGIFWGNFLYTFRSSLGDFDMDTIEQLTPEENTIFWFIWLIIVIITAIVFLNFIISEIGASYDSVKQRLEGMVMKERSALITETEKMTLDAFKDD